MQIISLLWGILAVIGNAYRIHSMSRHITGSIFLCGSGLIISIIVAVNADPQSSKSSAVAGIIMCGFAVIFGIIRLTLMAGFSENYNLKIF